MSFGNPRQPSTFSVGGMADADLQNQLTLYKPVATVRDMKQVYFYAGVQAGICWVHPLRFLTPIDNKASPPTQWNWGDINNVADPFPKFVANPWYLPMGTTRTLDISNVVNDLLDIRVPKDKYVLEINLVECNIESDPTNWLTIPDYVFYQPYDSENNNWASLQTNVTYKKKVDYSPAVNNVATMSNIAYQATKVSTPETLFVRIKELCNNEPYNWTVTNTGQYTLDKSQQLLVRHGDINYSMLTLEFGHLVFTGLDQDQQQFEAGFDPHIGQAIGVQQPSDPPLDLGFTLLPINRRKENYKYLDYNSEVFNAGGRAIASPTPYDARYICIDDYYVNEYKNGYYEQLPPSRSRVMTVQPANRPPFLVSPKQQVGGLTPDATVNYKDYLLTQGMPLKSNQQAKSIVFRFMVRIIHMF